MIILGINSHHPDSSAALIADGKIIAACEEERLNRIKHYAGFPSDSIGYCLKEAGISVKDVDIIAVPRKPAARLFKKLAWGIRMPLLAGQRIANWHKTFDIKTQARIISVEHHTAHLASSFFASGLDRAFLFSMDALGDFASTMWGAGEGNSIKVSGEETFPHSLGFYYSAITQYLGFTNFGDEYKVMGLASYGEPAFEDEFENILKIKDGGFELGLEYFTHHKKYIDMDFKDNSPEIAPIFSPYLEKRLGRRRLPGEPVEKKHRDIASSLQRRLERVILHMLEHHNVREPNLCLAGGVAYNCAANGKIADAGIFKDIYVPSAAGDAGLAIGAALFIWNRLMDNKRSTRIDNESFGPEFSDSQVERQINDQALIIKNEGCEIEQAASDDELCGKTARYIADGKIAGWFQGRMEFGPRALGNRSIIADPRKAEMKDILNARIKRRESFRPFAPSVLEEGRDEFFDVNHSSPFMSFVCKVKNQKRNLIPAVTHTDGTARIQTVNKGSNLLYWKLINAFKGITGVPVLLNTSFNDNEPIICAPKEAIDCFLRTKMDLLAIGRYIIRKR